MNKTTRDTFMRYFSNPIPLRENSFTFRCFEKLLVDNVDALFDSTQYDTYLPFQSLYVDGATMEDQLLVCNNCKTPLLEARERLHSTGDTVRFPFTNVKLVVILFLRNIRQRSSTN